MSVETCIRALTTPHMPRVWSVIVTLFGDLAQSPGDGVSAALLTRIGNDIGFKPEAMRVALYRLRKDGWIETTRTGRSSRHELTAEGRALSAQASPRIYAAAPEPVPVWHVSIAESGGTSPNARAIALGGNTWLCPGKAPDQAGVFTLEGQKMTVPDWLAERVFPTSLQTACAEVHTSLHAVQNELPDPRSLSPYEIAVLRVLIVHGWRRIVLRLPDLPARYAPDGWQAEQCRALTHAMLAQLPRPNLATLEELATG